MNCDTIWYGSSFLPLCFFRVDHFLLSCCTASSLVSADLKMLFDLVTLIFDLWPWPLNLTWISFHLTYMPKFRSLCLSVHAGGNTHTHTHNVKTITPVADAGCNENTWVFMWSLLVFSPETPSNTHSTPWCDDKLWCYIQDIRWCLMSWQWTHVQEIWQTNCRDSLSSLDFDFPVESCHPYNIYSLYNIYILFPKIYSLPYLPWRDLSGCNQDFPYFPQISQYVSTLFPNMESYVAIIYEFSVGNQSLIKITNLKELHTLF